LLTFGVALNLSPLLEAFLLQKNHETSRSTAMIPMRALWRTWIPEADFMEQGLLSGPGNNNNNNKHNIDDNNRAAIVEEVQTNNAYHNLCMLAAAWILVMTPQAGIAVSGGGLDFANMDITAQDFSNQNYKGKDFTQVIAKGTNFAKSNLQGCRFYKAYLVRM
jgi:uncharacterized protein YjbI with pentapeptide repeats